MIADCIDTGANTHSNNSLRNTALAFASRGWGIVPFFGTNGDKCRCGFEHKETANGAHPCGGMTYISATTDPTKIISYAEKWQTANYAVAPGRKQPAADYVPVVVETPADDLLHNEAMAQVPAIIGTEYRTCGQARTPYGTIQVYIEVKSEHHLKFGKFDGFQIHAEGSYVMIPGSQHYSGGTYQWDGQPLPTVPVIAVHADVRAVSKLAINVTATIVSSGADVVEPQQGENGIAAVTAPNSKIVDFRAVEQATKQRIADNRAIAAKYIAAGFKLCRIAVGTKGPKSNGWQDNPISLDQVNHEGLGLIHALSGTCVIDLDNFESAVAWFEARDIDLHAMLDADDAVQIRSGVPNRGKLVYRLPPGVTSLPLVQVKNVDGSMLIEFRCAANDGAGCQDVLPPTIHPRTDKPYEWAGAGDFKTLAVLPPGVHALWQSLVATKSAMQPQAASSVSATSRSIPEGGRNNALFKLAGNMARAGCSPDSIRAALLIENRDRCQPPLADHEVERIAKSAAMNSYGAKEAAARAIMANETDEEALELAKKALANADIQHEANQDNSQPELPDVMRDIAGWSARSARTVQPAFDLCTALAACSSVLARDFICDGSHTNLYTVAVGPSGSGKENALRTVSKIIDAYAPERRAGKPASDTSVLTVMGRNPASTFVMDELGEVLQGVFSAKAANHQARIGTVFMDLFTKGGETYRGTEYAIQDRNKANGRERTDLFSPCPSIFGATTAVTLFKGMSPDVIGSGFFPRIMYFRAPDKIPMPNFDRKDEPMPASVRAWLTVINTRVAAHTADIKEQGDLIGTTNHQYLPINVPYSAAANLLVQEAQKEIVARRNACVDDLESTMLTRIVENASRVALTLALASDPWAVEVSAENFKTALAIVTNAMQTFTADIRANLFDSQYAKIEVKAYEFIKAYFAKNAKAVGEGTLVDRCKPYGSAPPSQRDQAIKSLLSQGKITSDIGHKGVTRYLPRV